LFCLSSGFFSLCSFDISSFFQSGAELGGYWVVLFGQELFLQGVQTAGFSAENLKELLEVCMYVCFGQYDEFQNSLLQKCCKLMPFTLSIGSVAPQIYPIVSSEFRPLEADCGAQSTLYQSYA
jgi:hypothetical protein